MTLTTLIILNALAAAMVSIALVALLGHAIHTDRFMHRAPVHQLPERDLERLAA